MSMGDLTRQSGAPDLELSTVAYKAYDCLVRAYRDELQAQRDRAATMPVLGCPGGYRSAQDAHDRLELKRTGPDGIVAHLDRCIAGFDGWRDALKAKVTLIQAEDQAV